MPGRVGTYVLFYADCGGNPLDVFVYCLGGMLNLCPLSFRRHPWFKQWKHKGLAVGRFITPPIDDLIHLRCSHSRGDLDILSAGPLRLSSDKGDPLSIELPLLQEGNVLHVYPVTQVGEDPKVPRASFIFGGRLVGEYLINFCQRQGILQIAAGGYLVSPFPKRVELRVHLHLHNGVVVDGAKRPQVDTDSGD